MKTLTQKIIHSPTLANFLFSDSRTGKRQGSYLPVQVLLLLLLKEDMREEEPLKISLRQQLLHQLKIRNSQVQSFVLEESEFSQILLTKLGFYF